MAESSERALTPDEAIYVTAARAKALVRYVGARTRRRSCGIAQRLPRIATAAAAAAATVVATTGGARGA